MNPEFVAWLASNGYDANELKGKQAAHLEAAWKAETQPAPETKPAPVASSYDEQMDAIARESDRIDAIQNITAEACKSAVGNRQKVELFKTMAAAAIADQKCDVRKFQLDMLRAGLGHAPYITTPQKAEADNDILECAVAQAVGVRNHENGYNERTLEAAHKQFPRGIGLKELLAIAGKRNNGYRGSMNDEVSLCKAAFGHGRGEYDLSADGGVSSISVPGILSNVANKSLEAAFLYGDQSWRGIARVQSLRDFKTATMYRLGAGAKFVKVPPTGHIQSGTMSELTYSLKADTYGIMIGLSRTDIINDDLNAFNSVADEIGRGAIDSLNDVFWTDTWLAGQASYFPTNDSYDNYVAASTAPLSLAGLDLVETKFRLQTKADGTLLGAMPKVLLVPAALSNTALALMGSMGLVVGTTPASGPAINVFNGRYQVVSSPFLDATSQIVWWMLADPRALAAIQVGFLNGVDRPVVQSSEFDFDTLGLAMRGYLDFGCSMMEYRAGVKSKGTS